MKKQIFSASLALSVLFASAPAFATVPNEEENGMGYGLMEMGTLVIAGPAVALGLGLGIADLVYAADGEWAPKGLAITEIVSGVLVASLGGLALAASAPNPDGMPITFGAGVGMSLIGPTLLGHGIASLALSGEPDAPKAQFIVLPTAGGASGSLTVHF